MSSSTPSGTPQLQTALVRKLKNIEPDYRVEFIHIDDIVGFRIVDNQGRFRSKLIDIKRIGKEQLKTGRLRSLLKSNGFPEVLSE